MSQPYTNPPPPRYPATIPLLATHHSPPVHFPSIGSPYRVLLTLTLRWSKLRPYGAPRWRRHRGGRRDGFRPAEIPFGHCLVSRLG